MNEIMIYAEITRAGFIHPVFFELACAAQELSKKLDNAPVCALILCKPGYTESVKEGFEKCGFDKVYAVEDERLEEYYNEWHAKAAVDVIKEVKPAILLIGATNQGRDLAPRISSSLGTGLTADCVDLDISQYGLLAATRPTFGGQLMATIMCKTKPQMASVRPKVFKPLNEDVVRKTEIIYKKAEIDGIPKKIKLLKFIKAVEEELNALEYAQVVVTGGMGMKNVEGFRLLEELASVLNGQVAATRSAVYAGLAKHNQQVGQTGLTISPKLYIACGVSGAVQHIVGMCNSDKIIAINVDSQAPIFENCDIGYVGDVFEVVPDLIKKFQGKLSQ